MVHGHGPYPGHVRDPLFQNHLETGIEVAAGVKADKDCGVSDTNPGGEHTDVDVPVGGTVPTVLALSIGAVPSLGTFQPAVAKDYEASVAASVVSSATAAALTVRDTSATATGRLVNGSAALAQPLQVKATDAANTYERVRATLHHGRAAGAARLPGSGRSAPDHDRLQAADRRHRQPLARQLRQDADVHAVGDDAVSKVTSWGSLGAPPRVSRQGPGSNARALTIRRDCGAG